MWLMLPSGALSIVKRRDLKDKPDEVNTLQIRARRAEYLDEFRKRFCPELTKTQNFGGHDYPFRGYVTPEAFARAAAKAALAIDYTNFKDATEHSTVHGLPTPALRHQLHGAYSDIWYDMLKVEPKRVKKYKAYQSAITGIEACKRWGHWWPIGNAECKDCGKPNPNGSTAAGPSDSFPTTAEVNAWHKAHPAAPKPTFPGGVATTGSITTTGSTDMKLTGIAACLAYGHWWDKGVERCIDCLEPNPNYPEAGPVSNAEVVRKWWSDLESEERRAIKTRIDNAKGTKTAQYKTAQPKTKLCKGSWTVADLEDDESNEGLCKDCGYVIALSQGQTLPTVLRTHYADGTLLAVTQIAK